MSIPLLPLFVESQEDLSEPEHGPVNIQGLQYYLHPDLQGTEPAVETLKAPPPGKVVTYRLTDNKIDNACCDDDDGNDDDDHVLLALGVAARQVLHHALPRSGAVLLRGIPAHNAEQFATFWQACKHAVTEDDTVWDEMEYINFGHPRAKQAGVDTATNIPPEFTLNLHNENSYNPQRPRYIGLYCLQQSTTGGESLIAWNAEITPHVPVALMEHIQQHGGILYERSYRDANAPVAPMDSNDDDGIAQQLAVTWQDKCGATTRQQVEAYWLQYGFQKEHLVWESNGTLHVRNVESGVIPAVPSLEDDQNSSSSAWWWYNNLDTCGTCADGSGRPPLPLLQHYQSHRWKAAYAFRLQPGDWLVLDNRCVQHGRLPYPPRDTRRLLTVLIK
eukprot:scaffold456_cov171-Amphora_coffeaeformis.AAC.16